MIDELVLEGEKVAVMANLMFCLEGVSKTMKNSNSNSVSRTSMNLGPHE
jgi:hypothetical protein